MTKTDFDEIFNETKYSVIEMLDFILKNRSFSNYILIMAEADYKPEIKDAGLSPYVIDSFSDKRIDNTRLEFYEKFLNDYYSFKGYDTITDDTNRMHLEMMIYSHLWESKPFLKKLSQLSHVVLKDQFLWEINVPTISKHDFIRNKIKQVFYDEGLKIAEIIKKGFHSTLRNAFAHSDYVFNVYEKHIRLHNYTGKSWDIDRISFDDWAKRFAYSSNLNYHFLNEIHIRRISLNKDFGRDTFEIEIPENEEIKSKRAIKYNEERDSFEFV